jgi:hypothetical protein
MDSNNTKPYLYQQFKALDLEKVRAILKDFNIGSNKHVQRIFNPIGGQGFLFYSDDMNKAKDYKVDGYVWKNNSGSKPCPISNPILFS